MVGPSERSPSRVILGFFDEPPDEPFSAPEIADETDYSVQTVQNELETLVRRGLLRSKEVAEGERIWWPSRREGEDGDPLGPVLAPTDAADGEGSQAARQRVMEQHRQLAEFVTRINITDDLDEILRLITEEARNLVGAHQSVTSRTVNQNWEQAINAVSLSEKYAEYRDYETEPDGSGIYAVVCERNQPMRMTQSELESHPAWNAFGDEEDEHPPMEGWVAVPIVAPGGQNMGLIQLSDKYEGEFTEADEAILVQLATIAAAAIENARLYDELHESKERYRSLFNSMAEGYCVLEKLETAPGEPPDFRFVEVNPAFTVHTNLQDVVGETVRNVTSNGLEEWIEFSEEVIQTGDVVSFEYDFEPQGRVLQCQAFPVGDTPTGRVGVTMQDVTERVEHERRLKESNERLEQFAYAASHDLQEPLRMVSSYLQMIEQRYGHELDEEGQEFIDFAVDGADRMRKMVDGLLEYSRVEAQGDPFEPVDLNTVVTDAREDIQVKIEDNDASLSVEDLPTVEGDASQLRQVFQNLLDNAIEYSGDDPPEIHVGAERTGDEWVLSVEDEGIGIDPDHADRIFEVFKRLHGHDEHTGTGIGLALCERVIERHGGDIWVESEPGAGSTFSFTLPASNP